MFTVYKHTNKANGMVYVGITKNNPESRWNRGTGYKRNKKFFSDIQQFGWDGFEHEVIADGLSEEQAVGMEKRLIADYQAVCFGYNNSCGGSYAHRGALDGESVEIKNGFGRQVKRGNVIFRKWYDFFCRADCMPQKKSNIAERLNLYTPAVVDYLGYFRPNDEVFLALYVKELTKLFQFERIAEQMGE